MRHVLLREIVLLLPHCAENMIQQHQHRGCEIQFVSVCCFRHQVLRIQRVYPNTHSGSWQCVFSIFHTFQPIVHQHIPQTVECCTKSPLRLLRWCSHRFVGTHDVFQQRCARDGQCIHIVSLIFISISISISIFIFVIFILVIIDTVIFILVIIDPQEVIDRFDRIWIGDIIRIMLLLRLFWLRGIGDGNVVVLLQHLRLLRCVSRHFWLRGIGDGNVVVLLQHLRLFRWLISRQNVQSDL